MTAGCEVEKAISSSDAIIAAVKAASVEDVGRVSESYCIGYMAAILAICARGDAFAMRKARRMIELGGGVL